MNGTEEKPGVCDRRNSGFKSLQGSISHSAELRGGITHLSSFRSFLEESASETKPTCSRSTRPPRLLGSSLPVPVFLPLRACTWADPALVISSLCKWWSNTPHAPLMAGGTAPALLAFPYLLERSLIKVKINYISFRLMAQACHAAEGRGKIRLAGPQPHSSHGPVPPAPPRSPDWLQNYVSIHSNNFPN